MSEDIDIIHCIFLFFYFLFKQLINATDALKQEDVKLRTLLSEFNTTLSTKVNSKISR